MLQQRREEEEELGPGEGLPQALPPPVPERDEVVRLAEPAALVEKPKQSLVMGGLIFIRCLQTCQG